MVVLAVKWITSSIFMFLPCFSAFGCSSQFRFKNYVYGWRRNELLLFYRNFVDMLFFLHLIVILERHSLFFALLICLPWLLLLFFFRFPNRKFWNISQSELVRPLILALAVICLYPHHQCALFHMHSSENCKVIFYVCGVDAACLLFFVGTL